MSYFKKNNSLEERKKLSSRIISKYPDRRPVIVEPQYKDKDPKINRTKYLVPIELTMGKFISEIRKEMKIESNQSLFFLINNILPPCNAMISLIYDKYKDPMDNFLYIKYTTESTFG